MLKVNNLSKELGNFQLNDISFSLPAGYICGLIGQNGAGKTTLLHLILGLYHADEGNILVNNMLYENQEKTIHDIIGTVLTEDLFEPSMTLIQNSNRYGKYYSKYNSEYMDKYLSLFHLNKKQKFGKLSRGEKLKYQFAFALSHEPKLLILDEPTGNFDSDFREQFFHIIKEFIKDGTKSVILATHITDDLDRIADYIIYLEEGKQVFAGDIEELHQHYRMVYGEKYKINLLPKERIIHMEENAFGAKALISHSRLNHYDKSLDLSYPTIEELMYFYTKRKER